MADIKDTIYTTARMTVKLKEDTDRILSYARAAMGLADFLEEGVHYIDAYIDNINNELVFVNFDNVEKRYKLSIFTDEKYVHGNGTEGNKIKLSKSLTSYSEGLKPVTNKSWRYSTSLSNTDAVLVTDFTWSDGSNADGNFTVTRSSNGNVLDIAIQNSAVKTDCPYFNINIKASTPGQSDYTDKINMNITNPYYYALSLNYQTPLSGTGRDSSPVKLNYNATHFTVSGNALNIKNYLKYYMGPAYWESPNILTLHLLGMNSSTVGNDKIVIQNPLTGNVIHTAEPIIDGDMQHVNVNGVNLEGDFILLYAENVNHKMVSDAIVLPVYRG